MLGIRRYNGISIDLWQGDITIFCCDVMVNAANSKLEGGGGVDGAIHLAGGPSIIAECQTIGGCAPGMAVRTTPGELPCNHLIHTVGPIWEGGSKNEDHILSSAYSSSLNLANQLGCRHIAFSAISCGVYKFPHVEAAHIAMHTIKKYIDENHKNSKVRRITVVLFSSELYNTFQDALFETFPESE